MGMFDEIKVNYNLPLPGEIKNLNIDWKEVVFQTKDLENLLTQYLIENDGLYQRIVELEYVEFSEEEKKQNRKEKRWFPFFKDVIEKSSYHKKIDDFHGSIVFYHYEELNDTEDFSVDFKATFSYGKLDKIELLSFEKTKSRKISNEEWKAKIEEEAKKPWNRFKCYANRFGWNKFWRFLEKTLYKFERSCSDIRMFLIRYFF
jgi:hypothetical protein